MPHRKIIREWLKPLSDRSTLRAFVLLLVDTALFMGLVAGTVLGRICVAQTFVRLSGWLRHWPFVHHWP
jgi:hypothetical protein